MAIKLLLSKKMRSRLVGHSNFDAVLADVVRCLTLASNCTRILVARDMGGGEDVHQYLCAFFITRSTALQVTNTTRTY